jgi:hypothetical protein
MYKRVDKRCIISSILLKALKYLVLFIKIRVYKSNIRVDTNGILEA